MSHLTADDCICGSFLCNSSPIKEILTGGAHLKGQPFSVIEEHEDGHLDGGHLQYVLPSHLSIAHASICTIFLQIQQKINDPNARNT